MKILKRIGILLIVGVIVAAAAFLLLPNASENGTPAASTSSQAASCSGGSRFTQDNLTSLGKVSAKFVAGSDRVLVVNDAYYVVVASGTSKVNLNAGDCFFLSQDSALAYVASLTKGQIVDGATSPSGSGGFSTVFYILLFLVVNAVFVWLNVITGRLSRHIESRDIPVEFAIEQHDPTSDTAARRFKGEGTVQTTISLRLLDATNPLYVRSFRDRKQLDAIFKQVSAVVQRLIQVCANDLWLDQYTQLVATDLERQINGDDALRQLEDTYGFRISVRLFRPELDSDVIAQLEAAESELYAASHLKAQQVASGFSPLEFVLSLFAGGLNRIATAAQTSATAQAEQAAQSSSESDDKDGKE